MPEPTDAELLSDWLIRQREPAFHALVARYAGLVHMAAMRTCDDETLAAEASQLAFITLARKAKSLLSRGSIAGWLHLTAVMHAKNLLRQHRRESRKRQLLRTHMDTSPPDHAAEAAWKNMQPVLDDALASLSSSDREALLLRFYRSLSVKEIAAALGIATDAAQKRLDRATARLRQQLARRGCQVGGTLGAAMLVGFGADAQAAVPGVSTLATKALAGGGAGGTSFLTIALVTMTKKTAITAGAALLLVGAGAALFINHNSDKPGATPSATTSANKAGIGNTGTLAPVDEAGRAPKIKPRDAGENPDLVSKYGESRTNLSKHVANNVISLFEDGVEMGEMMTSGQFGNAFGGPRAQLGRSLRGLNGKLNLTEEQQQKAAAAIADYQKREIVRSRETIDRLKKDPSSLMKLMLASDAFARGEMGEEQYKAAQLASGDELKGVLNPLDEDSMRGRPLKEEQFRREFEAFLDPAQAETYQREMAEQQSREATEGDRGSITNMPSMELEKLDSTITSAKKFTTGLKSMMEGMGGLQDLGPMVEEQRKAREARQAQEGTEK